MARAQLAPWPPGLSHLRCAVGHSVGGCGGRVVGRVTCVCILSVAVSAETLNSVNSVKAETGPPLTGVCLSPAFTCPRTCVL